MKKPDALAALAALAQENRLDVFRLLVEAGQQGLPAGAVAEALKLAPNTLTFHFDRLRDAGLVTVRRDGRSMIYAARYATMNALIAYLTENCCRGRAEVIRSGELREAQQGQGRVAQKARNAELARGKQKHEDHRKHNPGKREGQSDSPQNSWPSGHETGRLLETAIDIGQFRNDGGPGRQASHSHPG